MVRRSRRRWCSAVVTGAGTGIGREIALGLAAKDCIVFGTAMSAAEVQDLKVASGGRVSLAVCDMTKAEVVEVWAGGVSDALDGAGLELLINTAHVSSPGPIEILPADALRRSFEVTVFGTVSVVNAFLPALRRARGRIVQLSDWTASLPLPFAGVSAASKAALEALSSAYRSELRPFGVDVVVMPVGRLSAGGGASVPDMISNVARTLTAEQRDLYAARLLAARRHADEQQWPAMDVAEAAARVIELAAQDPAPSRAPVGPEAEAMLRAAREQPDDELDKLRLQLVGIG